MARPPWAPCWRTSGGSCASRSYAGIDQDLLARPGAYESAVDESGSNFSGGQRQRLPIARAIVRRPRILLLDEATSSLDNRTQSVVSRSLANLRATRIVIAHRLSTIVDAGRIHVVQAGRIVQSGTYRELIDQGGQFDELVHRQLT